MSRIKIGDFTSAESWAILPRKMAFKSRGQNTTCQQPVMSFWVHKLAIQYGGKRETGGRYCVPRARNGRSCENHEEKGI